MRTVCIAAYRKLVSSFVRPFSAFIHLGRQIDGHARNNQILTITKNESHIVNTYAYSILKMLHNLMAL